MRLAVASADLCPRLLRGGCWLLGSAVFPGDPDDGSAGGCSGQGVPCQSWSVQRSLYHDQLAQALFESQVSQRDLFHVSQSCAGLDVWRGRPLGLSRAGLPAQWSRSLALAADLPAKPFWSLTKLRYHAKRELTR